MAQTARAAKINAIARNEPFLPSDRGWQLAGGRAAGRFVDVYGDRD